MNNGNKNNELENMYNMLLKQYYTVYGEKINAATCLFQTLGVHEFAWDYKNVFVAIEILKDKKIPIAGGDVCYEDNGNIDYTYDSWGIDLTSAKSSHEQTIDYINNYIKRNRNEKEKYLFVLVFDYKKYLDLHRDDEDVLYIH